jgi:hypothetical protein
MNPQQTIPFENTALIPCFLCGNGLEIRTSKRNKPYLICDWCGVQTFIRGQRGIKSFYEYKNSLKSGEIIMTGKNNLKITASINCLAELKAKVENGVERLILAVGGQITVSGQIGQEAF